MKRCLSLALFSLIFLFIISNLLPSREIYAQTQPQQPTCSGGQGIDTAIGCILFASGNPQQDFIGFFLKWAVGIGGGIAFLLIVYSAFMVITSQGNPERLKAGQELLGAAISGLILIIFSVFILRVIGVDILKIPGFGT